MDQTLHAHVRLDIASDAVRIDVRGSITRASRPSLIQVVQHVRRMGITSHISVDLGRAAFVESSALAGLRNDLAAIDAGSAPAAIAGGSAPGTGVSLELSPRGEDPAAVLQTVDRSGGLLASADPSGTRPLARYSAEELLAASDFVFGRLDDPEEMACTELLASYEEIGREISRREAGHEPDPG